MLPFKVECLLAGKGRVPVKLLDQVQQRHNATQITGGSSAHLVPQTPSMTARQLHPGLQSYSSTPGATPSLTPPRTLMSSLQVRLLHRNAVIDLLCSSLCLQSSNTAAAPCKCSALVCHPVAYGRATPYRDALLGRNVF